MMVGMTLKQFLRELRDQGGSQTLDHCIRVANLMYEMAKALGYSEEVAMRWFYAGLLHDAGKLFVPANILGKKTALTAREYAIIMTHVKAGEGIIRLLRIHEEYKQTAVNCANYHHAWRNGKIKNLKEGTPGGYYKGMEDTKLSYSAIPEEAQACEVCDIYEALTANRSYSSSMSTRVALQKMDKMLRDGQINPKYYRVLVERMLHEEWMRSEKVA